MDLIERYLKDVERRLPGKLRADVTRELRSLLEDACEGADRNDESRAVAVLREFGPPAQMAASYIPTRQYLIGPELYPAFMRTMKICLTVIAVLTLVGLVFDTRTPSDLFVNIGADILLGFSDFWSTCISLLGTVVIIFAVFERFAGEKTDAADDWDPRSLPALEDPDVVDKSGEIIGMAFVCFALLMLNVFPHTMCLHFTVSGDAQVLPLLGPGWQPYLVWLNSYLGLGFLLALLLVRRGRWNTTLRVLDLLVHLVIVGFFYRLVAGRPIQECGPEWLSEHGIAVDTAEHFFESVVPLIEFWLQIGLVIALIATVVGAVRKTIVLFRAFTKAAG